MSKIAKKSARKAEKNPNDEFWYVEFENFFFSKFRHFDCYKLLYGTLTKAWFIYDENLGYFKSISLPEVRNIYFQWAADHNVETDGRKTHHIIERLQSLCAFDEKWNPNPNIENTLDTVIELDTWDSTGKERITYGHDPRFLFNYVVPRHYKGNAWNFWGITMWQRLVKQVTPDSENFFKYLVSIVHKRHDDEIMGFVYGPAGSGKSTILQTFGNMYGFDNTSTTKINKAATRFGCSPIYGRRVNVAPDNAIIPMNEAIVVFIKDICELNATYEVEMKGITPFKTFADWFLIFGINQLMTIGTRYAQEIDSIMRRILLIECPTRQKRDVGLKEMFLDSDFLDDIYTWAVNQEFVPIITNVDEFIEITTERYFANADPVLRICRESFQYTGNVNDGIFVTEALDILRTALESEGYPIPRDITAQLTQTLRIMKIDRNDKTRGAKAMYVRGKIREYETDKKETKRIIKNGVDITNFDQDKLDYLNQYPAGDWVEESNVYDQLFGTNLEYNEKEITKVRDHIVKSSQN